MYRIIHQNDECQFAGELPVRLIIVLIFDRYNQWKVNFGFIVGLEACPNFSAYLQSHVHDLFLVKWASPKIL